jgi:putative membrane protein
MFCGPGGCGFGFGFGILGIILSIAFWVLIIAGIVALIRYLRSPRTYEKPPRPEKTPLEVLKERYAKGEISKEEFERMKKDLEG